MTTSTVPLALTRSEAVIAFENAATARSRLRAFIIQDVLTLQAMAETLARAVRELATLFTGLDSARRTTDAKGRACSAIPFTAEEADEYALVEALFWDRLSDEAEVLLKTQLRHVLGEVQP